MLTKRIIVTVTLLAALLSISATSNSQADSKAKPQEATVTSTAVAPPDPVSTLTAQALGDWNLQRWVLHENLQRLTYLNEVYAEEVAKQEAARRVVPKQAVTSTSNPGSFLDCVRNRESGGNYSIYNSGGSGAAGAYQFMPGTWNNTARSAGRPDLVGVSPADASPADQDAMAQHLYSTSGSAPWGGYCG